MLNVMYHYVRPFDYAYPYLNSLDLNVFKRQLDYFERKYGFLSQQEYKDAVSEGENPTGVVLTFDDGLKDHVRYVAPELKKRGLWGIFYVSTGVYHSNVLLGVHRVHCLKAKFGAALILKEIIKDIDESKLDHDLIDEFDKEIYQGLGYEEDEKKLRRLFNFYIKYEYRDEILDRLMHKFFDEDELFKKFYMSEIDIEDLILSKNIVGSHTVSHKVLSRLSYKEQFTEIKDSFSFLNRILPQNYRSFCYPYGHSSSYNCDTIKVLKKLQVDDACVFDNNFQHDHIKKFQLSRIDCNQFLEV